MNKFAKMTLAAMAVEAASVESAQSLVQQALLNVEAGSAAAMHLENAMSAMAGTKFTDAEILAKNSQNVNVPIDEKRALTLKVSPTYTLDSGRRCFSLSGMTHTTSLAGWMATTTRNL